MHRPLDSQCSAGSQRDEGAGKKPRVLVAIPVYNEQRYVTSVLGEVRRYADDILVIDDGSTDETPLLLAEQPVEVIRHATNRGYGQSMIDAFRWAACYGYDWLVTMDCDEQHEPASLPDFYRAIAQDNVDVISGSRYLTNVANGSPSSDGQTGNTEDAAIGQPPSDRRKINRLMTEAVNQTLGLSITDAFCGFKAYRVSKVASLSLTERGYAFPMQFWVQAKSHGLRVREVPIRLIYNDPNRSFGGPLDDADHRLAHYRDVFQAELLRCEAQLASPGRIAGVNGHGRQNPVEPARDRSLARADVR